MNQPQPNELIGVPNCDGNTRYITRELADAQITLKLLKEKEACAEGIKWFDAEFPEGCSYIELRAKLASSQNQDWECWLLEKFGGDTATAGCHGFATVGDYGFATAGAYGSATAGAGGSASVGDRGTATAGNYGTAIAGNYGSASVGEQGSATAGDRGTATAGDRGTATVGEKGSATAGDRGTAIAGNYGTAIAGAGGSASAGSCGTIIISYWDEANVRYRSVVGYVGENGIKANVAYIVEEDDCILIPKK